MTEAEARNIELVRAFEQPLAAPWGAADRTWASAEASRRLGEQAPYPHWLAQRAALASARLAQRLPPVARALAASSVPGAWLRWLPLIAFALGLASDAIGSPQRINLLAPPFLALMAWNLAVYAALLLAALRAGLAGRADPPAPGPLRRALWQVMLRGTRVARKQLAAVDTPPALIRFWRDWLRCSEPLQRARLATLLHLAAAALCAGMLVSLYVRGLAFEYRAGWDSTFLTPQALHHLLTVVLGPAAQLSGMTLPDADQLARLRFSVGPGENAARWIHWYALSVGLLVLLPRVALGALAAQRVRQLSRHFPLPLIDSYFQQLRPTHARTPTAVLVLPYSYQVPANALLGLNAVLEAALGPNAMVQVAESIPLGGEDELARWLAPPGSEPAAVVVLFALSATPERDSHGALLQALAARPGGAALTAVLIDESGFRARFDGAQGQTRLQQRRAAWQRLLHDFGQTPVFADLSAPDLAATQTEWQRLALPRP